MTVIPTLDHASVFMNELLPDKEQAPVAASFENKKRKPAKTAGRKSKKAKMELPSEHIANANGKSDESPEASPTEVNKPKKETPSGSSTELDGMTESCHRSELTADEKEWLVQRIIEIKQSGQRVSVPALYQMYTAYASVPLSVLKNNYDSLRVRAWSSLKKSRVV
ncbi:hypothetical protein HDU88_003324 [Geranomyces variabilis]|nr:hypothetical protein HDU88_003324 [Geranomyces variabilis]